MSSIDLAWAAGFWDGEGCCSASSAKGYRTKAIRLFIHQSFSPECLIRFQDAVGGSGYIRGPYTKEGNSNLYWTWSAARLDEVLRVMEMLKPLLSSPKQDQYDRVLRERKESVAHLPVVIKPTKEDLERMYWVEGMTLTQIGSQRGVTVQCVSKWMKKLDIPTKRTASKSSKKIALLTN